MVITALRAGAALTLASVATLAPAPPIGAVPAVRPAAASATAASTPAASGPRIWPAAGAPAPGVPRLVWHRCADAGQRRLKMECTTIHVPLDYAKPKGPTISLDLARHKATGVFKGAVFVNPGGPGGSAISAMGRFLTVLGTTVTSSLDVIAMDPRGVGSSSKARCWSRTAEPEVLNQYPITRADLTMRYTHDAYERAACAATGRPIIDHMSTGDVARDMDLVRQALQQPILRYYGVSYGTVLGATYASMFPSKVGPMVLDGVVDPVAWTTGYGTTAQRIPVSARGGSGAGSDETLLAAFHACKAAGPKKCPHGARIEQEWRAVVARLKQGDVTTPDGPMRLADVLGSAMPSLYDPDSLASLMDAIHDDYLTVTKAGPAPRRPRPADTRPMLGDIRVTTPQPDDASWWDTYTMAGVMCSDSINPANPAAWQRWAADPRVARSWFSGVWTWNSSLCASWPGHSTGVYRGPFTVRPRTPLLVVGNTHDPATPLSGAKALAAMSPGARLLTVDAFGHTAADKSRCASDAMRGYLTGKPLPKAGTVCRADKPLF